MLECVRAHSVLDYISVVPAGKHQYISTGFVDRLYDFIVTVSNTSYPVSADELVPPDFVRCGQFPGSPGAGGTGTVVCSPEAINGRFVYISLPQPRSLMMCEVEVRYEGRFWKKPQSDETIFI